MGSVSEDVSSGIQEECNELLHDSHDLGRQGHQQRPVEGAEVKMSKNQMKKLAKRQRMLEFRACRRKQEKERKKIRRLELLKQCLENGDEIPVHNIKRKKLMSESDNNFKVVIDMNYGDYMTEDEIGKASKQVGRIYSLNRHSDRPCQLYVTSLKGKVRDRFSITNTGYENWDINISELDYLELFSKSREDNHIRDKIIYLTADTDETLPSCEDLLKDDSKIFIIGGIVDHNRHKNLSYNRAIERRIRTAKLPIKDHVQLCQRYILSTVAVFEILLNVLGSRLGWREAFISSIPKRKLVLPEDDSHPEENGRELVKASPKDSKTDQLTD